MNESSVPFQPDPDLMADVEGSGRAVRAYREATEVAGEDLWLAPTGKRVVVQYDAEGVCRIRREALSGLLELAGFKREEGS